MADSFKPRKFQRELIDVVRHRVSIHEMVTTAYVAPGSGKTLGWQAVLTDLIRTGHVSCGAVFVPRLNLATAAEIDYRADRGRNDYLLFDQPRLEQIYHRRNAYPLIPHGVDHAAYITTYSSLVSAKELHITSKGTAAIAPGWAEEHENDFLLVADEAQFCGSSIDGLGLSGSTKAADYIKEMAQYAKHTLLLTGTHLRSDGRPLVLATYKKEDDGSQKLIADVNGTYALGVSELYLRDFEMSLDDHPVNLRNFHTGDTFGAPLSDPKLYEYMGGLREILRNDDVWQPIVDDVIGRLVRIQNIKKGYRALIACLEQRDAKDVVRYLERRYPNIRVEVAVSEDGVKAANALRRFKGDNKDDPDQSPPADILVTVRMAFIGYDCKQIAVIGILTNYRHPGHLIQLIGRGLRVWLSAKEQVQIVTTDDPEMKKFLAWLRVEADRGLKERKEGSDNGNGPYDPNPWGIEGVGLVKRRIENRSGTISPEASKSMTEALHTIGPITTASQMQDLFEHFGINLDFGAITRPAENKTSIPKTEAELVIDNKSKAAEAIGRIISAMGYETSHPDYQKQRARVTRKINNEFGITSTSEITTNDMAKKYVKHVNDWGVRNVNK